MTVDATGRQPTVAWKCKRCGMISETEWFAGRHGDRRGGNGRCSGEAEGPYYLLSQDEYLDVVLAAKP